MESLWLYRQLIIIIFTIAPFLLLPRLGLWSRDKAAKGKAVVAIGVVGRMDTATAKVEVVGVASARSSTRRPAVAFLTRIPKLSIFIKGIDPPAPHKEEWN